VTAISSAKAGLPAPTGISATIGGTGSPGATFEGKAKDGAVGSRSVFIRRATTGPDQYFINGILAQIDDNLR
jgi:hypothetical protein